MPLTAKDQKHYRHRYFELAQGGIIRHAKISVYKKCSRSFAIALHRLLHFAMAAQGDRPTRAVEDEMSDEQMEELLAQATARLRERESSKALQAQPQKYTFPKLDAGNLDKSYITSTGDVAEADRARLLEDKQRQSHGGIRKVEDPVVARKIALEVCSITHNTSYLTYREENNPKLFPRAESGCRFGIFLPT